MLMLTISSPSVLHIGSLLSFYYKHLNHPCCKFHDKTQIDKTAQIFTRALPNSNFQQGFYTMNLKVRIGLFLCTPLNCEINISIQMLDSDPMIYKSFLFFRLPCSMLSGHENNHGPWLQKIHTKGIYSYV